MEAAAERARLHDLQQPSESRARASADGERRALSRIRLSGVPDLYRNAEWGKVRSPAIHEWALGLPARTQRRSSVEQMPPNWALLGHGLLIIGPVGTGKSSAAALVSMDAARLEKSIRWTYVPDLCDRLTLNAKSRSEETRKQELVDLLVWDDFGVRDLADWEIGFLDQIVEARYRARKPMLVTTNWLGEDLRADERLARMVDRWRERVCSNVATLGGESMRSTV